VHATFEKILYAKSKEPTFLLHVKLSFRLRLSRPFSCPCFPRLFPPLLYCTLPSHYLCQAVVKPTQSNDGPQDDSRRNTFDFISQQQQQQRQALALGPL